MNQTSARPPNLRGRVQTFVGGVVLVGAGLGAWWMWWEKYQTRKDQVDLAYGKAPTWEYRIYQAQHPADNANNPVTLRQGSSLEPSTLEPSTSDASRAVPYAPQTKSGSSAPQVGPSPGPEPTPQRTNDDGRVYSKAPTYFDSYKEKKNK